MVVTSGGCGNAAPSDLVEGTFGLQAISGAPLPATLSASIVVVSESLRLDRNGHAVSQRVIRILTQGDPDTEVTEQEQGSWTHMDSLVTVTWGPEEFMTLRIEDGGDALRSVAMGSTKPGIDVLRVYVYRRTL
jgi:hypothetical protein